MEVELDRGWTKLSREERHKRMIKMGIDPKEVEAIEAKNRAAVEGLRCSAAALLQKWEQEDREEEERRRGLRPGASYEQAFTNLLLLPMLANPFSFLTWFRRGK